MADWTQGDTVVDYITIVDGTGTPVTGATWVTIDTFDPDGVDFTLSITEVGGGVYKVQFTATKAGHYYWSARTTNLSPNQAFESDFDVSATSSSTTGSVVYDAGEGTTLLELVRMLATRVGDFMEITATSDGSADGTSITDELGLSAIPDAGLTGSGLIFVSPEVSANYLRQSKVIDSSEDSTILTLKPSLPAQVVTGDTVWLTNLHSEGYWWDQYRQAINSGILRSWPNHMVPVSYTPTDVWDANVPWISIPSTIRKIYAIQSYQGGDEANLLPIPMASQNRSSLEGWYWDPALKRLTVNDPYRTYFHGYVIRILGYGRAPTLTNPTDTTTVDAEWLVDMGYEELKHATGDPRDLAAASMGRNIADSNRGKITTIAFPGTIDIG